MQQGKICLSYPLEIAPRLKIQTSIAIRTHKNIIQKHSNEFTFSLSFFSEQNLT